MTLFWDSWDPAYARPMGDDAAEPAGQSTASVEVDVELPATAWHARDRAPVARAPDVVLFADGVLRVDGRGWLVDAEGASHPALAASYAAGVVRCDLVGGAAEVVHARVERALLTSAPGAAASGTGPARYAPHPVPGASAAQLDGHLRGLMSGLEIAVCASTRESTVEPPGLLVADGRLRGRRHLPHTIGYVKTQSTTYLPAELVPVVTGLAAGQRTPVFRLSSLYSWYLRLPGHAGGPWSGVIRVECSGDLTAQQAIALADTSAVTLPRFAASGYKDPRAPQNLVPIAGLERRLRGMLGDSRLLHRTLQR
ncbi:MAG: hypothetical protein J2P15_16860 [Micromonosporaceae bacterium]|nr:hypothetical protein [Micromonosporaceae bacterium]